MIYGIHAAKNGFIFTTGLQDATALVFTTKDKLIDHLRAALPDPEFPTAPQSPLEIALAEGERAGRLGLDEDDNPYSYPGPLNTAWEAARVAAITPEPAPTLNETAHQLLQEVATSTAE